MNPNSNSIKNNPVASSPSSPHTYYSSNTLNNLNKTTYNTHSSQSQQQSHARFSSQQAKTKMEMKPYPRTDFHFLEQQRQHMQQQKAQTPIIKSKPEPNIYGTSNANYLLKMKNLTTNQQPQPTQNQNNQNSNSLTKLPTKSSQADFNYIQYQSDREKFFAEYIKNNGDAATQIIPNFLYLGGHRSVNNIPNLITDKVSHVLNMAGELNLNLMEMDRNNIRLLNVLAKDSKIYNIRKDFDQAFQFIDECLKIGGKIIINCARGISRSGTIVIAYLMFRYSMSLMEAYNFITSLRPQVRPNSYFRKQLETYEHELAYNRFKIQLRNKQAVARNGNNPAGLMAEGMMTNNGNASTSSSSFLFSNSELRM